MKLKNTSRKFMFLIIATVVGIILSLSACDGSSPGARLLSGGNKQSIHAHGQEWHGVTETSSFPGPDGQLAIRFVHKGRPYWCFPAGCISGGSPVNGADMSATTRSGE